MLTTTRTLERKQHSGFLEYHIKLKNNEVLSSAKQNKQKFEQHISALLVHQPRFLFKPSSTSIHSLNSSAPFLRSYLARNLSVPKIPYPHPLYSLIDCPCFNDKHKKQNSRIFSLLQDRREGKQWRRSSKMETCSLVFVIQVDARWKRPTSKLLSMKPRGFLLQSSWEAALKRKRALEGLPLQNVRKQITARCFQTKKMLI